MNQASQTPPGCGPPTDMRRPQSALSALVRRELWFFYLVVLLLLLLLALISYQGVTSPWYQTLLQERTTLPLVVVTILWSGVYIISLIGFYILFRIDRPGLVTDEFFMTVFIIGLLLSLTRVIVLYLGQNLFGALIIQLIVVLYYIWYTYEISKYNRPAALLQIPLILMNFYLFYLTGDLTIRNIERAFEGLG